MKFVNFSELCSHRTILLSKRITHIIRNPLIHTPTLVCSLYASIGIYAENEKA